MNYYIHVPFCRKKCDYCAFYSCENASAGLVKAYLDKLSSDIASGLERQAEEGADREELEAETLFVGGGTPNYLSAKELEKLFSILEKSLHFRPGAEVTVEVNPASLDRDKLEVIRGFANRLSIGVQSFDAEKRRTLGRTGSNEEIASAFALASELKFPAVSLDLIYNIPGQTAEDFAGDLRRAAELGVAHLSCYSLTNEEKVFLSGGSSGRRFVVDDELADRMWTMAGEMPGMERYEVSNYARSGAFRCRHNVNVWKGGKLLGFGPAASSFDGRDRYTQVPDLARWLGGEEPEYDRISPEARMREIFAVNLRTVDGWSEKEGKSRFGGGFWEKMKEECRRLAAGKTGDMAGKFDFSGGVALTEDGLRFWDGIALELI